MSTLENIVYKQIWNKVAFSVISYIVVGPIVHYMQSDANFIPTGKHLKISGILSYFELLDALTKEKCGKVRAINFLLWNASCFACL